MQAPSVNKPSAGSCGWEPLGHKVLEPTMRWWAGVWEVGRSGRSESQDVCSLENKMLSDEIRACPQILEEAAGLSPSQSTLPSRPRGVSLHPTSRVIGCGMKTSSLRHGVRHHKNLLGLYFHQTLYILLGRCCRAGQ